MDTVFGERGRKGCLGMKKEMIQTKEAPDAIGPYSQGAAMEGMVFTSGQLGIDLKTGNLAEGVEAQAHAAMRHIGAILKEAGLAYENILKTTIFVKDLGDFQTVNQVYASYFPGDYPARSCVQVAALPLDGLVEIECVALRR